MMKWVLLPEPGAAGRVTFTVPVEVTTYMPAGETVSQRTTACPAATSTLMFAPKPRWVTFSPVKVQTPSFGKMAWMS
jgi:hypothetical protein